MSQENQLSINSKTLQWNSPLSSDTFNRDEILSYKVRYDRNIDIQVPEGFKRLSIEFPCQLKRFVPPIIPNTICYLDFSIGEEQSLMDSSPHIVSMVKKISIPSSVVSLSIMILAKIEKDRVNFLNQLLFDRDEGDSDPVVVKKSRKLNNYSKETTAEASSPSSSSSPSFIPSTVKTLSIYWVDQFLLDHLPKSIETLILYGIGDYTQFNVHPKKVIVKPSDRLYNFPPTLQSVYFSFAYQPIKFVNQQGSFNQLEENLPIGTSYYPSEGNLVYLELGINDPELLFEKAFPNTLKYLDVMLSYFLSYKGYLPKSVEYLNIFYNSNTFKHPNMPILVPSTLKYLQILERLVPLIQVVDQEDYYAKVNEFNQVDDSKLTKLAFLDIVDPTRKTANYFNRPYSVPKGIQELTITTPMTLVKNFVPASINKLTIVCKDWHLQIHVENLPKRLGHLELDCLKSNLNSITTPDEKMKMFFQDSTCEYSSLSQQQISQHTYSIEINSLVVKNVNRDGESFTVDKCVIFYSKISQYFSPNQSSLVNLEMALNIDSLSDDIKDLTLSYYFNKPLLSKIIQQPIINADDAENQRFLSPLIPSSDMFFLIWRNKYLKNIVLHQFIHPSNQLVEYSKPVMGSTTILLNEPKSIWNWSIPSKTTKIVVDPYILTFLTKSIPPKIGKLLDGKYHVHIKSKAIPHDTTHLIWPLNEIIQPNTLPNGLISIIFNNDFNVPIIPNSIPDTVLSMRFGINFTSVDLDLVSFPPNLQYLYLSYSYCRPIKPNTLPNTLKLFEIGYGTVKNNDFSFLPPSCDHLSLLVSNLNNQQQASNFTNLPSHVKYLKAVFLNDSHLGFFRNTFLSPTSIKCVTVSEKQTKHLSFHQVSATQFPNYNTCNSNNNDNDTSKTQVKRIKESIRLHINIEVNEIIKPNTLIDQIKSITFGSTFNQPILANSIPPFVETIIFGEAYDQPFMNADILPRNLVKLVFGSGFNRPIDFISSLMSLEELEFGKEFYQLLKKDTLPQNINKLVFKSGYYHRKLLNWIPSSVTDLTFGDNLVKSPISLSLPIDQVPSSITRLTLCDNQSINSVALIPSSIKHLRLGPCQFFKGKIPLTVESLELGNGYNQYPLHLLIPLQNNYL
ncbi:hypothetical protein CYY_008721 [Polysphondylium violaceum]|uniref:FNIP repeat-containing protein n=1 Tax=Polysphondylium violaceum TaxID=133409 RepID=A0A8J4PL93_9MYCE|nr:hypothetical protein CYY_008721 [Polysphondylium violaceum]